MIRREFLGGAFLGTTMAAAASAQAGAKPKFGIDVFSLRSQGWSPFEYLDYVKRQGAHVCFFSEIRFLGGLEAGHLKKVREHAAGLGLELEIGNRSICPSSKAFDAAAGAAEEQLTRLLEAASIVGSKVVRCFLGTMADRPNLERCIGDTVAVLRKVRTRAMDAGVKIAVENHAGDMQARELKGLIEAAGKEFVGACIDSGNATWTLEDPHLTLETLAPYCVTSGVRDSQLWRVPEGVAMRWVRMGEGNVDIGPWVKKYVELCPGKTMALEIIVLPQPRVFAFMEQKFWEAYRGVPAWEFSRFLALAEKGKPSPGAPVPKEMAIQKEREDLEASAAFTRQILKL